MPQYLLIMTQTPDLGTAQTISEALLNARVAACVSIMPQVMSRYVWEGKLEAAEEWPLLIKTTQACYEELEQIIVSLHPYQVPEIIALPISQGLPAYLQWLTQSTQPQ